MDQGVCGVKDATKWENLHHSTGPLDTLVRMLVRTQASNFRGNLPRNSDAHPMPSPWDSLPLPDLPGDLLRRYFDEESRLAQAVADVEKADTARREGTRVAGTPWAPLEQSGVRLGELLREIREKALADPAVTTPWRKAAHAESLERVKALEPELYRALEREGALDVKALDDVVVKRMLARLKAEGRPGRWPGEA